MDVSLTLIRGVFLTLCMVLSATYSVALSNETVLWMNLAIGLLFGGAFGALLIGVDILARRFNLRSFNIAILGLFFGYLLGQAFLLILGTILDFSHVQLPPSVELIAKGAIFLSAVYIGMIMTARAAGELYVSLPFIKFKSIKLKKKDILLEASVLNDSRIIDLASSGLLDDHLVIPRYVMTELYAIVERGDEGQRNRARKNLEVIKKLESLPALNVRYSDTDIPDIKDSYEKLVKLARILDANILTGDISQIQQAAIEDVRIIKFQQLCNALKPLSQSGELLMIKIQRYGKEPRQGVGYLDDGTMVVVNGGAEYIGETVKAHVLSVKHTSSGRMIFCNAFEEHLFDDEKASYHPHTVAPVTNGTRLLQDDSDEYLNMSQA